MGIKNILKKIADPIGVTSKKPPWKMGIKSIHKKIADPMGINPGSIMMPKNEDQNLLETILDPVGLTGTRKDQHDYGKASTVDGSWEEEKKMKRGGLVTKGSKKEKSRLTGKFKIV